MFIVIEGADAVGKETQAEKLTQRFADVGHKVRAVSFHRYKTPLGRLIKAHLTKDVVLARNKIAVTREQVLDAFRPDETVDVQPTRHYGDAMMFQCMAVVDKYEGAAEIADFIHDGGIVVCDRWWQSAYAYGAADGLATDWLLNSHRFLPQPDFNILIEVSHEEAKRRRPVPEDRYEERDDIQLRVRTAYTQLWQNPPSFAAGKWVKLDGEGDVDTVHERIVAQLDRLPMTQQEAFLKAQELWGPCAVAGRNYSYRQSYHVGVKNLGVWEKRGAGYSFEAAFADVKDFPDGHAPQTHGAKRAPDRVG